MEIRYDEGRLVNGAKFARRFSLQTLRILKMEWIQTDTFLSETHTIIPGSKTGIEKISFFCVVKKLVYGELSLF